jgi:hypothetical protein
MTAIAAPEAPVTVIRNRKATTDIELGVNAKGEQVVASVSSHHNKESRVLTSVLSRVTIKQTGTTGFVVRQVIPMDSVGIMTEPTARYSDKALAALHEESLAIVNRVKAEGGNAKVNAIFAPAE